MYIQEITVRNYLIHRTTSLHLTPITVFVGPNGGGKSAFFDAILNFSMVARGNIRQAFSQFPYSFNSTKYHGAGKLDRIGFDTILSRTQNSVEALRYRVDYTQQGAAEGGFPMFQITNEVLELFPSKTVLFDRNHNPYSSPLKSAVKFLENDRGIFAAVRAAKLAGAGDDGNELVAHCATEISRFNRFRLNPFTLAGFSRLPDISAEKPVPPRLGHEGEDLAACLYYMQETNDPALQTILEKIQAVVPGFQKFDFNIYAADRLAWAMQFGDERGLTPSVRISHGTLLFVGLMVLCYSPNRPPVMLIEEPENGLTPTSLREFYRAARELAHRDDEEKRSQILISSHSPFIICEAWNGDDRDFIHQFKVEDGHSVVRKFSEVITQQGAVLAKDDLGKATRLGLRNAELLMAGYLA
jgi:predicted ATPase